MRSRNIKHLNPRLLSTIPSCLPLPPPANVILSSSHTWLPVRNIAPFVIFSALPSPLYTHFLPFVDIVLSACLLNHWTDQLHLILARQLKLGRDYMDEVQGMSGDTWFFFSFIVIIPSANKANLHKSTQLQAHLFNYKFLLTVFARNSMWL